MFFSLIKVEGHSMEPFLKEGSFFIGSNIPYIFRKPKEGDVVLFKNNNKIIVKKIIRVDKEKISVEGINKSDNMKFSPVRRNEILGKLLIKL